MPPKYEEKRSEELQGQHYRQKDEAVKRVQAVLREKLGWTSTRSMAELIVDNKDSFREALGF